VSDDPLREEPKVNTLPAASVDDRLLITPGGYEDLRVELERLRDGVGPALSERLRDARQDGHLSDNPPLFDLLEEQAQLDRRIAVLEAQLAAAQIAAPATDGRAGIGSRVLVRDLGVGETAEYELVGAIEPRIGDGRVSVAAPVGGALVGQRVGARLNVATPGGTLPLEVLSVQPAQVQSPARKAA
jgi:transcription elongation factor GreA